MDSSINHLEFSLKYDAANLLSRTDVCNLSHKDLNILKLICSSGLYPNIAIADGANPYKPAAEQMFHTKTKRFISMHPTSVFTGNYELLHPKSTEAAHGEELKSHFSEETLESIRPKTQLTELICYLELVQTNKAYLTNVFRVPAAPSCLLFAHKIDVSPCLNHLIVDEWLHIHFQDNDPLTLERYLVLANFLRVAWDYVIGKRLSKAASDIPEKENDMENTVVEEQPLELYGTAIEKPSSTSVTTMSSLLSSPEPDPRSAPASDFKRKLTNWAKFKMLPDSIKRMRHDWEGGTGKCTAPVTEEFSTLEEFEISGIDIVNIIYVI